jgi:hypothetical protein
VVGFSFLWFFIGLELFWEWFGLFWGFWLLGEIEHLVETHFMDILESLC